MAGSPSADEGRRQSSGRDRSGSSLRQLTHELVASVLEVESVQLAAAEFVWASLTGAEKQQHGQDQAVTPAPQDGRRETETAQLHYTVRNDLFIHCKSL